MDSLQQQRVEDIFSTALTKPDGDLRSAYIEQACGSDVALRSRVEALLRAHEHAGTFLEPLLLDPAETVASIRPETPVSEALGKRIGRYKLIERIGEGGFGVVYLAEQSEPVRRSVALKIIKLGMDTKQIIARFEAERQALAMMDHPHIAKVLDAGATETGRPYFVMELVRGVPITQYCDNARLTTAQRLELFLAVCDAVQHAHHKGIVHRDIKPSNVMVTLHDSRPVPKIIDFGIAKATSQRLTDKTLFTGFREFIGTPEYMSPDQLSISGMDVDSRTDVYSLGVLLYELLTSRTPFDAKQMRSSNYEEIQRLIREVDPPKPSTRLSTLTAELPTIAIRRRVEPGALGKLLRGDLDWVVMKAMEKDRGRRYQTVSEFAGDVQRHLNDEPVLAGPPRMSYKLSKFIRRNRVAVGAAAVVGLALVVGFSAATVGLIQANRAKTALARQRDEAQAARSEAEQARALEEQHRQLAEASAAQAQREAENAEAVNRFLQNMLGSVDPSKALGREISVHYVLDEAASELDGGALAEQPEVEAAVRMTLGRTYEALGVYRAAQEQLQRAGQIRERALGAEHPDTWRARSALASLYNSDGRFSEGESLARSVLQAQRRALGERHPDTLATMSCLGVALWELGKLDEAETLHREALVVQQQVLGPDHIDALRSMVYLGTVLLDKGEHAAAESLLSRALETERQTLGDLHPETLSAMNHLALSLERQGKFAAAEALYRQSLASNRRILGDEHPRTRIPMNNLMRVLRTQGKMDETRPLVAERLQQLRRAAEDPAADALALHGYAWELVTCEPADMRDPATAMPFARRAVELDGGRDADLLDTLATVLQQNGELDESIRIQRQAVARARGGGPYNVAEFENRLSMLLLEKGDIWGAASVAWGGLAAELGEQLAADAGGRLASRGQALMKEGKHAKAEPILRVCLATRQKELPAGHWLIADTMIMLGETLAARKSHVEAEELLLDGFAAIKDNPKVSAERKQHARRLIVALYEAWGKPDQAQMWRRTDGGASAEAASS